MPLAVISTEGACGPVPLHVAAVLCLRAWSGGSSNPNADDNSLSSASSEIEEVMALVVRSVAAGEHSVSMLDRAAPSSDKEMVSDSAIRQLASHVDASAKATI